MKLPPWSYTMLDTFENCPRKVFHRYILGEKEPSSPATERGNYVHKAMENRVKKGTSLPADLIQFEPIAKSIVTLGNGAQIYTEAKLGVDKNLLPSGFFSETVWGRGAADVMIVKKPVAWVGDYKTGKSRKYEKSLQSAILALFIFKNFPGIDKVTACNIWLELGEIGDPFTFNRSEEPAMWAELLPRIQKMEDAVKQGYWPEKPSGLCGFCPVKTCKYNKS